VSVLCSLHYHSLFKYNILFRRLGHIKVLSKLEALFIISNDDGIFIPVRGCHFHLPPDNEVGGPPVVGFSYCYPPHLETHLTNDHEKIYSLRIAGKQVKTRTSYHL